MLKAHQVVGFVIAGVVGGFVVAGIAGVFAVSGLAGGFVPAGGALVQGCSQEEPGQLTLLGEGGCRTADGGQGIHTMLSAVSVEQCEEKCLAMDGRCMAFEYNSNNNDCEIHFESITSFEEVAGVSCYGR